MIPEPIAINLSGPITSVQVLDNFPASVYSEQADIQEGIPQNTPLDFEAQKAMFSQACQTLHAAAAKLNEFYERSFVEHKDEITKLSVEIARRILVRKVEDGDYEIESIIKAVLQNAPSHHDVVVHLNPEDHAQCQEVLLQEQQNDTFVGIKFVPDWSIGRAECLLETPKGIIKSLVDENLERISQALRMV